MDPACAVLHYALECFEGMKAYVDTQGHIRLFRPEMNMKRLNNSMKRLLLPEFDGDELIKCLNELLRLDKDWIPQGEGYSLYIPSEKAKLFIILSPVGPYYPEGFNPVKLVANDRYIRAWPGGTGGFKVGANYAPGILPQYDAHELGTMNLFIHLINDNGEKELITPPLSRGDILPGITRDSILHVTRNWNEFKVTEGNVTMKQVQKASRDGRIIEIFGSVLLLSCLLSPLSIIWTKIEYST
ncbi:putative aminotransferase class IV, aminotransferase-like, PLP-dependent enzyme [Plasmopara halstedii]